VRGRDRMLTALRRGVPDAVPVWELIINEPVIGALGYRSYADLVEGLDLDGCTAGEDLKYVEIGPGEYRCEWGIVWRMSSNRILYPVKGPIKDFQEVRSYEPPDPDVDHRLESLAALVDRFKGEKCIVFLGHDAFEFSHYLVGGLARLFELYYRAPELAHELAEKVIEYKCRVMERAVKEGADVLLSGDDYANASGPFLSPALFAKFVLPYLKRCVNVAKRLGVPFVKHTDGNVWRILDMLVEAGIDALHPIEPAAGMRIEEVKRRYGDRIAVIGNVDCSIVLPLLSELDVVEVVKETIAKAAPGGGFVLSSSNSIHPGVKPENFLAMVKAAREYGRYPIPEELAREYSARDFYAKIFGGRFAR